MNFVATIGSFDGLHIGHQKLIDKVLEVSKRKKMESMIVTFKPHPRAVISGYAPPLLITDSRKEKILSKQGFSRIEILNFSRKIASMHPDKFLKDIISRKLFIKELILGFNHHLGVNKTGNIKTITDVATKLGIEVEVIPPVLFEEEIVSSTYIRNLLINGKVQKAMKLLNRPYRLEGKIIKGAGRGKKLGFPTINIMPTHNMTKVSDGVYAIAVFLNRIKIPALAFAGNPPTFEDGYRIELHIPEWEPTNLPEKIEFDFFFWLRKAFKFDNISELKKNIREDVNKLKLIKSKIIKN